MQMTLEGFGDEASGIKKRDEFVAAARSGTIFTVDTSRVTDNSRKGEYLGENRHLCDSIRRGGVCTCTGDK